MKGVVILVSSYFPAFDGGQIDGWMKLPGCLKEEVSFSETEGREWGIPRRQSLLVPVNKGCFNDNEAQLKSLIDRQANATSCFQLILYQVVKICKDLWQIWFSVSRYYRMACLQTVFLSWRDDAAFDFSNTFMTFMPKDQWNHYPGLFLTDWTRKAPSYWLLMMTVGESERNRNRGLRRLMMLEKMLWESSLVDVGTFSLESRALRGPFIEGLVARRKNWRLWESRKLELLIRKLKIFQIWSLQAESILSRPRSFPLSVFVLALLSCNIWERNHQ